MIQTIYWNAELQKMCQNSILKIQVKKKFAIPRVDTFKVYTNVLYCQKYINKK